MVRKLIGVKQTGIRYTNFNQVTHGADMNRAIKDIITRSCSVEEKGKALKLLKEEIIVAEGILSGDFTYCPECDDYYLAKSYIRETETKETQVCVYEDWINSSGNEYAEGFLDITYRICPKGHRKELHRNEREK